MGFGGGEFLWIVVMVDDIVCWVVEIWFYGFDGFYYDVGGEFFDVFMVG